MDIRFLELNQWYVALALFVIAAFSIWTWQKMREARTSFARDEHNINEKATKFRTFVLRAFGALALGTLIVVGILHPIRTITVMEPEYESASTIFLLDVSKSQRAESGYYETPEGRLGAVKQTLLDLLSARGKEERSWSSWWRQADPRPILLGQRIGIVVFAGQAYTLVTPTERRDTLYSIVKHISSDDMVVQGTNFVAALEEGLAGFGESDKVRTVILVTDGEEDGESTASLANVLAKARKMHVRVFTVVVGHGRAPVPGMTGEWTESSMRIPAYIAEATGGESFPFDERGKLYLALQDVFEKIGEATMRPVNREQDLRPWVALLFLIVFGGITFLEYTRK